jgi:hypothetical protein
MALLILFGSIGGARASVCPNEQLRAGLHSSGLPDCRAYELVTPAVKYGWPAFVQYLSSSGDRAVGYSIGAFPGSDQASLYSFYEFMRDELGGWTSVPLNAPVGYETGQSGRVLPAAAPNLLSGVSEYVQPSAKDQRDTGYYIRPLPSGLPTAVGPRFSEHALESVTATEQLSSTEAAASGDMSHVLFMLHGPQFSHGNLVATVWSGDTTALAPNQGWASLYEYVGTGSSEPILVGVEEGSKHLIGECGTTLGYPEGDDFSSLQGGELFNAVSAPNGSRIFFTVAGGPCPNGGSAPPATELFAREEASPKVRRTVAISEPTSGPGGDCSACVTGNPQPAAFQGASEDGSKVFFLSEQELLKGAEGLNLYEYDFDAAQGSRVVLVAPDVLGVSRISEDGSRVYFVAGTDNLYVYDTETGSTSLVGALSEADSADWQAPDSRPVDATPDGRFLVFTSSADLLHEGTGGVSQVYEYDAQTKTLVRVSQMQGGAGGAFPASIVHPNYTGHFSPSPQPSSVSDDGTVVVFQSEAALTPQAVLGYNNVYEYRNGRVSLISDGQDRNSMEEGSPSVSLLGVDGSGRDIFFTTADQLVPQDGDTQEDVYDARSGGGFLPPASLACEGEGCQGALTPPLSAAPAGSLSQPSGEQIVEPPPKPVVKASVKHKAKKKAKRTKKAKRARGSRRRASRQARMGGHR